MTSDFRTFSPSSVYCFICVLSTFCESHVCPAAAVSSLKWRNWQLQSLEQEHRKLSAQLKDERDKNKHVVMSLVHECKQLAARVVEENQRFEELSSRTEQEGRSVGRLEEELASERRRSQQMEAEMEKQLAEFDTEREQLRSRLSREEMHAAELAS